MSDDPQPEEAGDEPAYRAGFACLVGRPNAGKSTLTNALVGQKVAITSSKPQTTRHTIRGIAMSPGALVLVDTPGLHKPRTLLGQRLNDLVRETLLEVDVIGFCLPADQRPGPGDTYIARELSELQRVKRKPVVAIATKSDRVDRRQLAEHLIAIDQLGAWDEIIPCSATRATRSRRCATCCPATFRSRRLYLDGVLTDEPEAVMIAELVREAARGRAGRASALPGRRRRGDGAARVAGRQAASRRPRERLRRAVQPRPSSSGVAGRGCVEVGLAAASDRGAARAAGVLDLHVKIAKDWQRDPKQLQRLGF